MTTTLKKFPKRERDASALEFTTGDKGLTVDRDKGVIYGVKIVGNRSQNNRTYPQDVLKKALPLYEGKSVNVSHPERGKEGEDRPFETFFGRLENVREDEGLRADLHYIKSHPLAGVVCEAAERFPTNFGLSHNTAVDWWVKEDGHRVCESINKVRTVDLVCRPATTDGIFESVQEQAMDTPASDPNIDPAGGNGTPAAPVAVDDDDSYDDDPHCNQFLQAAAKIFKSDGDAADKANRIKQVALTILKNEDAIDQAVNGKAEEDDDEEDDDDEGQESVREKRRKQAGELAEANKKLATYERQEKARDALESAGVEVTGSRIKAVAALESVDDRKALIGEFKAADAGAPPPKPKPKSVPANAVESQQDAERKAGDPLPTGLKPRTKDELKNLASSLQRR